MSVTWAKDGLNFKSKADAEFVYQEFLQTDGTPQGLVDYAAEHPDSEVYKCFTWDDEKAANLYRLTEARQVIRHLVFTEEDGTTPTKIRVIQRSSDRYEPIKTIMRDVDEYQRLLDRAYAELQSFKERYKNLVELEEVFEAIDALE